MSANFYADIPDALVVHARDCINSTDTSVQGAYLTGTVMGASQGKQAFYEALEADTQHRAESFVTDLGAAPTYPWEQPLWDRRKLQSPRPETLTGHWVPKPRPVLDTSGPWATVVPPTHERVTLAVAA